MVRELETLIVQALHCPAVRSFAHASCARVDDGNQWRRDEAYRTHPSVTVVARQSAPAMCTARPQQPAQHAGVNCIACGPRLCLTPATLTAQGRDSQRNLQRSIAARRVREGLPAQVASLAALAEQWAADEGAPFKLDGRDLKARARIGAVMPAQGRTFHQCRGGHRSRHFTCRRSDASCSKLLSQALVRTSSLAVHGGQPA